MSKPTLLYFPSRGRAELIRLVLAEAGVDYDELPIGKGSPPWNGRPTDLKALQSAGVLPFGAVPVWEEPGGLRLAQSTAIANHLARAHGLRGSSPLEETRCDELLGAVDDVRLELRKLLTVTPAERPALRAELLSSTLPRWMGFFERLLTTNRGGTEYVVGTTMTIADLALWYLLEMVQDNGFGAALEKHPALVAFFQRSGDRPRLAAYRASGRRHPLAPLPT